MKRNSWMVLVAIAVLVALVPQVKAADLNLDFTLINKTGYAIKEVYVAPSASDNWEENILKEPLADGESLDVSFDSSEKSKKWDLRIVWVDGGDAVYWRGYDLTEISKITLKYNARTDTTSASTE